VTFQDKAQLSASERFFLVRMTPRRFLSKGSGNLVLVPEIFTYTIPTDLNINKITINDYLLSTSNYVYNTNTSSNLIITSPTFTASQIIKGMFYKIKTVGTTNWTLYGAASNTVGLSFQATATGTGTGTAVFDLEFGGFGSNVVVLEHDLYFTGTKHRETLGISGLPDAKWEPLIANYSGFSQSMQNIAEGVFSLSGSNLELISTDRWAQSLVGTPDPSPTIGVGGQYESLSSCPVSVWACIDSAENNRKIFDGEVASFRYNYGTVSLSIIDTFQKLNNTASFGTREQSEIFKGQSIFGITASPNPDDQNKKIPFTLGKSSPYTVSLGYKHIDPFSTTTIIPKLYHLSDGQQAYRMKETDQALESYWLAGRSVSPVKLLTFGPMFAGSNTKILNFKKIITGTKVIDDGGVNDGKSEPTTITVVNRVIFVRLANLSNFNGEIGDVIPGPVFYGIDGEVSCGVISGYGSNIIPGQDYNLAITLIYDNGVKWDKVGLPNEQTVAAITLSDNTFPSLSVWVEADDTAEYEYDLVQIVDTGSGNLQLKDRFNYITKYLPITSIFSAPEYDIGGKTVYTVGFTLGPNSKINLATSIVKCRFSPSESMNHSDALKFIVKSAGMEVNDASFTQAAADLDANVSVTFPLDGQEFPSYLEAAQAITSSTIGLLRVNQSRQVEYELIKNPSALTVDSIKSPINMLEGQTSSSVDYQDLASRIEFENPQLNNLAALENIGPKAVVEFPIVKYLHKVDKTKKVTHVLENIAPRRDAIAGYFASPTVEYSLATASEDLASSIGDIVEIQNTAVADTKQTTKGVIVALDQSGSTTSVKVNEIRGVE